MTRAQSEHARRTVERYHARTRHSPPDALREQAKGAKTYAARLAEIAQTIEGHLGRLQVTAGIPFEVQDDLDRYAGQLAELEQELAAWTQEAETRRLEGWNRAAESAGEGGS